MKTIQPLLVLAALLTFAAPMPSPAQPAAFHEGDQAAAAKDKVNYSVRVQWKDAKGNHHLEVLTSEGAFELNTVLMDKVKINDSEIPITISLHGDLAVVSPDKARLKLFLGRTLPYITGSNMTPMGKSATWAQHQVGLNSTFVVTLGKTIQVQSDENEDVSVLIKRVED